MTWTIESATLPSAMMDEVAAEIDGGAAGGYLAAYDGATKLVTFTFDATAGTESGGVLTISSTPITGSYVADGTIDNCSIFDSNDNEILSTTSVGTSNADVVFSSLGVSSGLTITLESGALTI